MILSYRIFGADASGWSAAIDGVGCQERESGPAAAGRLENLVFEAL